MPANTTDETQWEAVEEAAELLAEGQEAQALEVLRDVVRADPRNPYGYHLVGVALSQLSQLEAARDAFRAAVRLAPDYLGARVGLSHTLRLLGQRDGALTQAKEALRRFPGNVEARAAVRLAGKVDDEVDEGGLERQLQSDSPEPPEEPDWEGLRVLTGGRDD
ncbi:MAG: tetratricopeptide repeat protein [Deltaproteobacteria bacterium]|nr:tetratricopeptide repeat protein [Deltaproteobacteria bacterium]